MAKEKLGSDKHFAQRTLSRLRDALELASTRPLSDLEKQGFIQVFEFVFELAWNPHCTRYSANGLALIASGFTAPGQRVLSDRDQTST